MKKLALNADDNDFLSAISHISNIGFSGIALRVSFWAEHYKDELYKDYGVEAPFDMRKAVVKRKADFLAGRVLAKNGLSKLLGNSSTVDVGKNREPVWPKGVVGSISHTQDMAVCFLSSDTQLMLGVDIENMMTDKRANDIAHLIINNKEKSLLVSLAYDFSLLLTLVFSAKESLFKAISNNVGGYFNFSVVEVCEIDFDKNILALKLNQDLSENFKSELVFDIRFSLEKNQVLTFLSYSM